MADDFDFSGIPDAGAPQPTPDFSGVDQHNSTGLDFSGVDQATAAEQYSTPLEQAKTVAENVAGGATFNLSRLAESKLLGNAEAQKQRDLANPELATASEAAGVVTGLLGPEEALSPVALASKLGAGTTAATTKLVGGLADKATAPLVAKILAGSGKVGAKAIGSAVEASAYGLGQSIKEEALGDPGLTAENITRNMGYAAMFGAGASTALSLGGKAIFRAPVSDLASDMAAKDQLITKATGKPAPPTSLEDIQAINQAAQEKGADLNLPQYNEAVQATDNLAGKLNVPPHQLMIDALKNETDSLKYKMMLKGDSDAANDMRQYQYAAKSDWTNNFIPETIQKVAPNYNLAEDAVAGGEHAIDAVTDQYTAKQAQDAEAFDKLQSLHPLPVDQPQAMITKLYEDFPKLQQYVSINEDGRFFLKPYDATSGIQRQTWPLFKDVVNAANKDGLNIGDVRDLRNSMLNATKNYTESATAHEAGSIRARLMDYMQDQVDKTAPELGVRDIFSRYRMNEQNLSDMQKILGGSLDDKASILKAVKPEKVLDRVFGDLRNVQVLKNFLNSQQFDEMTANYLNKVKNDVTDPNLGSFNSNKFSKTLFGAKKGLPIETALIDHPQELQDLKDITTLSRALPDAPKGNPSETGMASDLIKKAQKWTSALLHPTEIPGAILSTIGQKIDSTIQRGAINAALRGEESTLLQKERMYDSYIKMERMNQKTDNIISSGIKNIFRAGSVLRAYGASQLTPEKFDKLSKKIRAATQNPEVMMDTAHNSTRDLYNIAPNTATQLVLASTRAMQFLASKLPSQEIQSPLSEPLKPSSSEIAKFNRYHETVADPLSILDRIQRGTLTPENIEALQTVNPKIYEQIQNKIVSELGTAKPGEVPYKTKLMLSMFLGQDLTSSLKQNNISSAQLAHSAPGMQAQPQGARQKTAISKITASDQSMTDLQQTENS